MGDFVAVNLDPSDERPQRRRSRTMWELMHPDDVKPTWRDLPGLIRSSLRLVWEAGRGVFLLTATLQLLTAIAAGLQLFATKYALDSVLAAGGGDSFTTVVPSIAILVGLTVVMEVAGSVQSEQSRVLGELVARRAYDRVLDVSTKIDLIAYESPDFYDRLRRANMQGQFRSLQTVQSLLGLVGATIAAVGIVVALTSMQPWLLPIVTLGYVPVWLVSRKNTRDTYRFAFGMTPNDRQRNYLQNLLLSRDNAKEVRAFNLGPFLRARYDRLYDERLKELRALARRRTFRTLVGSLTSSGVAACAAAALAYLYASGRLSLAATGASVFGLYQLRGRLQAMHFSVAGLYESTLFIRDYTSFLQLEPRLEPSGREAPKSFGRLEVDGVTFVYPEADRPALDDVTLEIGAGEIVALVGENGSGKTTLAKLVAGLYRPERGSVRWDGIDTRELDAEELRGSVAVIFQDFARFLLPARENVGLGRHEQIDDTDAGDRGSAARRCARVPRFAARGIRHDARPRVPRRLGSLDRPVAARRARAGVLPRCAVRDPRRADGCARRPGRERSLRADARAAGRACRAADLTPLLERALGRPDLRAPPRAGRRARPPRGADGARRPLRRALHPPGEAVRRRLADAAEVRWGRVAARPPGARCGRNFYSPWQHSWEFSG